MIKASLAPGLMVLLLAGTASAEDLTIASWGGTFTAAQREAFFDPFAAATGNRVLDANYTGGLGQLRAMAESGAATWDLLQIEAPDLVLACQEGLVQPIDTTKLKVADVLAPVISECGVGASGWSIVMGYNAEKLPRAPEGWADFWDLETFPGQRGMRRSAQYALEAALLADGVPEAEIYQVLATPEGVDRAFAKLDTLKANIRWWEAGAHPAEWLSSGEVVMSSSYVGRLVDAAAEGAPVALTWQGGFYSVDSWAIPAGAKSVDAAYAFLDFTSAPETQAAFSLLYPVAPVNPGADALIPEERRAIMPVEKNLEQGLRIDQIFWSENGEVLTERFNAWLNR